MGSPVLHRDLLHMPEVALGGGNSTIWQGDQAVLDLSSGAGVTCFGYQGSEIKFAIQDQTLCGPYYHAANWTCEPVERLAAMLLQEVGWQDGGVMFLNTGAEAVEGACKIAMQFYAEAGSDRPGLLARRYSYHGNTMFTLNLGDNMRRHSYERELQGGVTRMPAYSERTLQQHRDGLQVHLARRKPCVVVLETIGGTAIGIEPPDRDYLEMIQMEVAKAGGILIFDEVLCGNWRTGKMFAWQHYNVKPDIIALGKGLTGGYFPLSAVIVSPRIVSALRSGSGRLWHSTTNQNHPIGCAAGVAALELYYKYAECRRLLAWHVEMELQPRLLQNTHVKELTGLGTLWGLHLFGGDYDDLQRRALERGVAVYVEHWTKGERQTSILLAPPYCMSWEQLDDAVSRLMQAVEDCHMKEAAE